VSIAVSIRELEERIRGALAMRRMEFVSLRHKPFTETYILCFRVEPAHYWTLEMDMEGCSNDGQFFSRAVKKIRDWAPPQDKTDGVIIVLGEGASRRPQSFVLVRVYADGSRVRIGPAMSLGDAYGCVCWWNYFESGRYEAETL